MKFRHMGPCMVGLAIAAALLIAYGWSSAPFVLVLLLCPVMMGGMMWMMMGNRRSEKHADSPEHERVG